MISPSPTRQPPEAQAESAKKVSSTPARRRPVQSPGVRSVKSIFRPIFKGIYYLLQFIKGHKLITLAIILALLGSSAITSYVTTGSVPFVTHDPLSPIAAYDQGSADHIRAWLSALQGGDVTALTALQASMVQTNTQPDPSSLVNRFGKQSGQTWLSIEVVGVHMGEAGVDLGLDSFVEIDLSAGGSNVSSVLLIHFTTVPAIGGQIFTIDVLNPRQTIH